MTCTIQTLFMMPDDVYTLFNYKRALKKKAFGVSPHFPDFFEWCRRKLQFLPTPQVASAFRFGLEVPFLFL